MSTKKSRPPLARLDLGNRVTGDPVVRDDIRLRARAAIHDVPVGQGLSQALSRLLASWSADDLATFMTHRPLHDLPHFFASFVHQNMPPGSTPAQKELWLSSVYSSGRIPLSAAIWQALAWRLEDTAADRVILDEFSARMLAEYRSGVGNAPPDLAAHVRSLPASAPLEVLSARFASWVRLAGSASALTALRSSPDYVGLWPIVESSSALAGKRHRIAALRPFISSQNISGLESNQSYNEEGYRGLIDDLLDALEVEQQKISWPSARHWHVSLHAMAQRRGFSLDALQEARIRAVVDEVAQKAHSGPRPAMERMAILAAIPLVSSEPRCRASMLDAARKLTLPDVVVCLGLSARGQGWVEAASTLASDPFRGLLLPALLASSDSHHMEGLTRADLLPFIGSSRVAVRHEAMRLAGLCRQVSPAIHTGAR